MGALVIRCCSPPAIVSRSASSPDYDGFWPKMTRPTDRRRVGLQRAAAPAARGNNSERIRHRLWRFYDGCARADMDQATRLATAIETWWPAIQVALTEQVTNARTEGFTNHQTGQACRLRIHQHGQLPTTHHGPHRSHPTAKTSSMTGRPAHGEPDISPS